MPNLRTCRAHSPTLKIRPSGVVQIWEVAAEEKSVSICVQLSPFGA
jgi:hypothetical protein